MPEGGPVALPAIILAAGYSRRMGYPKPFVAFAGEPFIDRVARQLRSAALSPLVIVINPDHERLWTEWPGRQSTTLVYNPHPGEGMLSSVRCGLRALAHSPASHFLVTLVDMPHIDWRTHGAVAEAAARNHGRMVVAARGDRPGHPVAIPREMVRAVCEGDWPDGLRGMLRSLPDLVLVETDDQAVFEDIDTPSDFERVTGELPRLPPSAPGR